MTDRTSRSEYEAQDKASLVKEAENRGLEVTREDGDTDKEPTKDDYVRALLADDGATDEANVKSEADSKEAAADDERTGGPDAPNAQKPGQPAGQVAKSKEDLPPLTAPDAPVGLETTTGLAPRSGKQTGRGGLVTADMVRTEEEIEEENRSRVERSVKVRALVPGTFPAGVFREQGEVFDYVRTQREHDEDLPLPSWMLAIDEKGEHDEDGPATKAPPAAFEPGVRGGADDKFTREEWLRGESPRTVEQVRREEDDEVLDEDKESEDEESRPRSRR